MGGKREKPEDIVLKLRQVEVLQGQGKPLADAVRQIGVTVQTYYRWRKEYGGMSRDQRVPYTGSAPINTAQDTLRFARRRASD